MAAPRLRLRRGTSNPQTLTGSGQVFNTTPALVGEPFFSDTNGSVPGTAGTGTGDFYIADGPTSFVHVGGSSYTSRVDEFLTESTTTTGSIITLVEGSNNGTNSVELKSPASLTGSYDLTLPQNKPGVAGAYILEYDQGSEVLSFVPSVAGESVETQNTNTDSSFFLTFVDSNNTNATLETVFTDGELSYNPNTDVLNVSGSLSVGSSGVSIAGATSGTVNLITTAIAGSTTITFPATTGNVITTGDNGTVTSAMILNGTIVNDDINASAAIVDTKLDTISTADKVSLSALNIDGGTALTSLADADIFIVDDNASGANRKAQVSTISTYVFDKVSGDVTINSSGVATIQANSVELGTDTTGNYVADVTAGEGLVKTSSASETQTVDLAFKNAANLTTNTVLKWDDGNTQLVNSSIVDDGSTVTITGNLTVTGTNTVTNVQTTNTQVSDALLELGTGTTGTPAATRDIGLIMERGDSSNIFIGFDEGDDVFVAGTTTATGSSTTIAPSPIAFLSGSYKITDTAGTNESIVSYLLAGDAPDGTTAGRYLQNLTVDAGTY